MSFLFLVNFWFIEIAHFPIEIFIILSLICSLALNMNYIGPLFFTYKKKCQSIVIKDTGLRMSGWVDSNSAPYSLCDLEQVTALCLSFLMCRR